ncbi:MAG: MutS family DNA mismatch repair protein [Candidatus Magasanikbacteria bacterium]|nr:MutS family DNA mismatch repair protein [Candidatus Magasanikbacteria bacterium]
MIPSTETLPHIQTLLTHKDRSLIEVYFDIQTFCESVYGSEVVVLIEVGSFFEIYGVDTGTETCGKPKEIAEILNLQLTRKNKTIAENSVKNPLMAGFPSITFDRYIRRLIQEKRYTLVIIRQRGTPPQVERYVDTVLSPGVNMEYAIDHADNFITSLIVEKHGTIYATGYAAIDVATGKSYVFEMHGTSDDPSRALDEVFQLMHTHVGTELILTCGDTSYQESVLEYIEKKQDVHTKISNKRLSNAYQNELLKHTYTVQSFLSAIEFLDLEKTPLASEALALVIEFIIAHDARVLDQLNKPQHIESTQQLYLGNTPLEQLNIISKNPDEYTVLSYIDFTVSSMGKRLLKERLTHPICDKGLLEARYTLCEQVAPIATSLRLSLKKIYDIERMIRRMCIGRLHPLEMQLLYETLVSSQEIHTSLSTLPTHPLPQLAEEHEGVISLVKYIEKRFDLSACSKMLLTDITTSIFLHGFDSTLDTLMHEYDEQKAKLEHIRMTLEKLVLAASSQHVSESDYVQIKQLDKEGHCLTMTKGRYALIEPILKQTFFSLEGTVYACSDFRIRNQKTQIKITADIIDRISEDIVVVQQKIIATTKELYAQELTHMYQQFGTVLKRLVSSLSSIDVAVSSAYAQKKRRLTKPIILEHEESTLDIQALRHPLGELREENGVYVPNHIALGNKTLHDTEQKETVISDQHDTDIRGLLVYGINSSGKSSLMKSVGVAVLLAQAGFFVPAASMRFTLFREVFTRILAQDNFAKGLSSFAVEMMELKNIFNRATKKSLILGDELSHGTETLSAIAIVGATLLRLSDMGALFICTTHLHQLTSIPLLKNHPHIAWVHLSVTYDREKDILLFERTIQPGSGSSLYGLEFAESLHMDPVFLQQAVALRKELANEYTTLERITKKQTSLYHKDVYLSVCAICDKPVTDTHHIAPQQDADEHGAIGHIHKNHKYNLLPICEACHQEIHTGSIHITGFAMTSKGLQLLYQK